MKQRRVPHGSKLIHKAAQQPISHRRLLNVRQKRFISEYQKDLNATQAAIRSGYSKRSAHVTGTRLLKQARIAKVLTAHEEQRLSASDVQADRVLTELARIAFSDLRGVFDERGNLLHPQQLREDVARAIASVEVSHNASTGERVTKLKAWNKNQALETLAKHLGLTRDEVKHSGAITISWLDSPTAKPAVDVRRP